MIERRYDIGPDAHYCDLGPKLVIVMVGLPARGKSYITEKLSRYLNWLQYETRVFNVGKNRRTLLHKQVDNGFNSSGILHERRGCKTSAHSLLEESLSTASERELKHPASFFDPSNSDALNQREKIALNTLDELLEWLLGGKGCVAILDATNSTIQRRQAVFDRIRYRGGPEIGVLFLESFCSDPNILEKNVRLKLSGPDYKGQESTRALVDFRQRIVEYEKAYVPLGDFEESRNFPYLKLIDVGSKIITYGIHGLFAGRTVEYLLNFHLFSRRIWITRNGESLDDIFGKIGRHATLSRRGSKFAEALAKFIDNQRTFPTHPGKSHVLWDTSVKSKVNQNAEVQTPARCKVWTSMMTQAIQTSKPFNEEKYEFRHLKALDGLSAGKMEGLTFAEIEELHPEEMAQRRKDPLCYRWPGPGGEGYVDVIHRLRPLIIELERLRQDVVLITHRAVARVLLAYFQNLGRENLAEIQVPLGTVFAVTPQPYGVAVEQYIYNNQTDQLDLYQDK